MGDFAPYVLRSTDRGRSWTSIAGDLPKRGTVYAMIQDHVQPSLLFAGTEFGAYFSPDDGKRWIELDGLPTIAVRDIDIQRRENDLVLGTFGRGFWVLDDYSPLRRADKATLEAPATLFPVRDAFAYMEQYPIGDKGKDRKSTRLNSSHSQISYAVFCLKKKKQKKKKRINKTKS